MQINQLTGEHLHLPTQQALSPQTLIAVRALHETAALRIQESLTEQLQRRIRAELLSIEHGPMGRFLVDDAEQDCYRAISISPLDGIWYFGIQFPLAHAMLDSRLGQFPSTTAYGQRLTELECRLLKHPTRQVFDAVLHSWQEIAELRVVGDQALLEPPSQLRIQLAETGICVTWKITEAGTHAEELGMLTMCMPCSTLRPLSPLLLRRYSQLLASLTHNGTQAAMGTGRSKPSAGWIGGCNIPVSVNLARSTLHHQDLSDLQVGDVLMLEQNAEEPLEIWVSGFGTYFGRLGAVQGKKAIEITNTPADQLGVGSEIEQSVGKPDAKDTAIQNSDAAA